MCQGIRVLGVESRRHYVPSTPTTTTLQPSWLHLPVSLPLGSRKRQIPGACWPASLETTGSFRFSERCCLKMKVKVIEENTQHPPPACTRARWSVPHSQHPASLLPRCVRGQDCLLTLFRERTWVLGRETERCTGECGCFLRRCKTQSLLSKVFRRGGPW